MQAKIGKRELLNMIQQMAYMSEYQEGDVRHHLERIRGYCYLMASNIGLTEEDAEMISYACVLHDIGKVSIPIDIFAKTEKLSKEDWKIIENHTTVANELLKDFTVPVFQIARAIALSHHERWDGSGYPRKLRGESIPIGGRICAIADVFDALTTKRTYKNRISSEEALKMIIDSKGILFDANLVGIFTSKFEEILRIQERFKSK